MSTLGETTKDEQAAVPLVASTGAESPRTTPVVSPNVARRVPEWPCLCGARNRLRDLVCRNCGAPKP